MKPMPYVSPSSELIVKSSWNTSVRDDASLSSTLTADAPPQKAMSAPPTIVEHDVQNHGKPCRPVRTVQFDEDSTVFYENEESCAEELKEMWYTKAEYGQFKKEIVKSAKAILKAESLIDGNTMGAALEAAYASCFECQGEEVSSPSFIPLEIQGFMKNHYRCGEYGETVVGLERLVVRRISKDRQELRKCLFDIVFDLQKGFRADKSVLAHNIAKVSEEATRAGRLFAAALGGAQVPYLLTRRPSNH
mmetsp:Transcript_38524/g.80064  ORF Transcript_38524/g.80064 Transcript_38524/m.80064 type:complete len:248 (-) Transcript_38524:139-882(-)|eukprot:CAMPEP_0172449692 /NCGR_PEP_ID=MMETSP1065-20121228/8330_1 /TAXON_ID=265537 /ORGANISM="Amphiprora paludosa, Strain CCMP125" /LENGTH=247 /DNA_ID=CAMNT_0013201413 /DNA_START=26 /DNA_END=769 /DNA_ORIENTATION=+